MDEWTADFIIIGQATNAFLKIKCSCEILGVINFGLTVVQNPILTCTKTSSFEWCRKYSGSVNWLQKAFS